MKDFSDFIPAKSRIGLMFYIDSMNEYSHVPGVSKGIFLSTKERMVPIR